MGTNRLKKTQFDFLHRNMFPVVDSFWVFISKFIAYVLGSIIAYFFRFPGNSDFGELKERQSFDCVDHGDCEGEDSAMVASTSKYEFLYRKGISGFIKEPKTESFTVHEFYSSIDSFMAEKILEKEPYREESALRFSFEKVAVEEKREDSVLSSMVEETFDQPEQAIEPEDVDKEKSEDSVESFIVERFLEKPKPAIATEGVFEEKTENSVSLNAEDSVLISMMEETFDQSGQAIKPEDVDEEKREDSVESFMVERFLEKPKQGIETDDVFEEKAENSVLSSMVEETFDQPGLAIEPEDVYEEKSEDPVDIFMVERFLEKPKPGIETQDVFEEKTEDSVEDYINYDVEEKFGDFFESPGIDMYLDQWQNEKEEESKEYLEPNTCVSDQKAAIITGLTNDFDDEFIELELQSENSCLMGETKCREELEMDDDEEEDDSEHDELIERLRMELKMARTGGLPTILEESESPKMVQELGPLQIDDKFDHKHHMAEIQKVYKSYSDKMRKLDILNSQTMHAISLLQLKDSVRPSMAGKSSAPAVKSLLSQNVWPFKQRKHEADPAMKLIRDVQRDFETVYVGQVCLSWEILHWQYGKVKELLGCDSQGIRQYNQVAGEFQLFQVLVQRFLENEPFQGRPRVENYVKNRCALRHLLQVPVIKDDCSKYKNAAGEEDAVSSEILTDIIEESMHVFWEFLRADKYEVNAASKTPHQGQVAPHDPIDFELLMDVRSDLQKKEKRLKEIQRSTNCIIKKFQRQNQENLLDHALFIAQIELKLVSRVLNMSKINTDQLVWCHEKLHKINFSSRKIEIEPSFTLFPC